jgi:hypothetical protein
MATQPQVTTGGPRQLVLVAVLAGVLLLAVGLLVVRPLLGGSDQGQAPTAVTSAGAAPATTTPQLIEPSTSVTASAAGSVKDPFKPLVSTGSAAAAAGSGAGTATTTGGSATDTTAATGSTVAGAGAGTASTPGGGSSTERQVALVSIKNGTAKVTVDGKAYSVTEGESFAGRYRAVDINSECASFESSTTSFTLCEGEAVLK